MTKNDKNGTAVGLLGSFALLVGALLVFVLLLVNSMTDDLPDDNYQEEVRPPVPVRKVAVVEKPRIETPPTNKPVAEPTEEPKPDADATDKLIKQAVALIDGGDPETALGILEKILSEQPDNERALIEVSMIHLIDYRDSRAAVPYLERAFKVNPNNRMVLAELVGSYSEHDTVDSGIDYLQSLQEKTNDESSAYISLGIGQLLLADGREDEALPHLEKAVDGMPRTPELLSSLASTHLAAGNSDKAIEIHRKAIEIRKESIARLKKEGKPVDRARTDQLRDYVRLVRVFEKQGDLDSALKTIEEAKDYAPNDRIIAKLHQRITNEQRDAG